MMKSTVTILLLLLAAWMAASEWLWLCVVKSHCGGTANAPAQVVAGPAADLGETPGGQAADSADLDTTITAAADPVRPGPVDRTADVPAPTPVPPANDPPRKMVTPEPSLPALEAGQPGDASPRQAVAATRPLGVTLGDREVLRLDGAPEFEAGAWQFASTAAWVVRLTDWLRDNSRVDLSVIGEYRGDEINTSDWSDLGLARASELRDRLVVQGIGRRRVELESVQIAAGTPGLRLRGLDFSPLFEPLRVYFPSSSARLTTTAELEQYAQRAGVYIERHPAAMIRLTGHTDDTGGLQDNYALGLQRAREVAALLESLGVPPARLEVASEGESSPEADNDTERGKARNRRVQLQLISR